MQCFLSLLSRFVGVLILVPVLLAGPLCKVAALADEGTGLKTSASVDIVGSFNSSRDGNADDRLDVREVEIMMYAPVDHLFDGLLSVAAHRESGVYMVELHEAVISSSRLIPRSRLKVGQFFLGLGRLNRFHRHEWPFVFAPKVHKEFFGAEGALDTGGEYSFLTPLPFFLELTAGVTNGWTYGHSHSEGEKPLRPTHYGRAATYFGLPADGGVQTGVNYLSRTTADGDEMTLLGVDLVSKWRRAGVLDFLVQAEVWQRTMKPKTGVEERAVGAYIFPQYGLTSQIQAGVLLDYFTITTLKDIAGSRVANSEQRVVPTVTYKASEFSSLRVAYDWSVAKQANQRDEETQEIQLQATFMIGAHPAHEF
jgi:hypothetical protein